ncbi:MAG: hypothetical protein PHG24_02765 [Candidatus Pacebacteria bacterium]|nr:hypothetical protein [Candidatus Paceibacterota bacterium]
MNCYCYRDIEVNPESFSFVGGNNLLDFIEASNKGTITLETMTLSKNGQSLIFMSPDRKIQDIRFDPEELSEEHLQDFIENTKRNDFIITLTSEKRDDGIKMIFTISKNLQT